MKKSTNLLTLIASLTLLCLSTASPMTSAAMMSDPLVDNGFSVAGGTTGPLILADNERPEHEPGLLESLDKAEQQSDNKTEKKCMTVCEKWGEDCVINPRTGARKCRRMCKRVGQECF